MCVTSHNALAGQFNLENVTIFMNSVWLVTVLWIKVEIRFHIYKIQTKNIDIITLRSNMGLDGFLASNGFRLMLNV